MLDQTMLADTVDTSRVHETAQLVGQTRIEGEQSAVGEGARVENSYLLNVVVEPGAVIVDSVIIGNEDCTGGHRGKGYAVRWSILKNPPVTIGRDAQVGGCTIRNCSIGARSRCTDSFIGDGSIGEDNVVDQVYAGTVCSGSHVILQGPTEISEAWLGRHAVIDRCGYLEGAFSNDLYVVEFDAASGELKVRETLDVPHASCYGMNTINSTNSGNLYEQPDEKLVSLGEYGGLWHDPLLSHEPLVLGPCCWVKGWTKVIGKSALEHATADSLLMDLFYTNLMPFSVSGIAGASATGQVAPGERFDGLSYKQRVAAWAFTYAPGAVIDMVQRVAALSGDAAVADRIAEISLRSALALVQFNAHQRSVDLEADYAKMPKGWKGWLLTASQVINQHLASGLWEFSGGEPVNWRRKGDQWVPVDPDALTAIAPDALEAYTRESDMVDCEQPALPRRFGPSRDELEPTTRASAVDSDATVSPSAWIGPGVQVKGNSVVGDNVRLYRTVVDNSTVAAGSTLSRCSLRNADIGEKVQAVSSTMHDAGLAAGSSCTCARLEDARLEGRARVSPFADVQRATVRYPCIIGSVIRDADVDSTFMSYHMPGQVENLVVEPSYVDEGDTKVPVRAIPMLGGGLRALGMADKPIRMPCAFIGSNAELEAGAYVGFGGFVLGRLTGDEGLPPLTLSTAPGPERDEIGMVVHRFANMVITHFVSWAFQALGPDEAPRVGKLITSYLREGRDAVSWAITQREKGAFDESSPYARYRSLKLYSDAQLTNGLGAYDLALSDGRWEMEYRGGQLYFSGAGFWHVKDGIARWETAE